jgi:hypothetical protein
MNASEQPEVRREKAHIQEPRANPTVQTELPDHRSNRLSPPRNPVGPYVPDGGTFETFVGGAGI